MRQLIIFIFFFGTNSLFGQSIYTALHLNKPEDVRKTKEIIEISEKKIFNNSSGQIVKKDKKILNEHFLVKTEERFEQGKLTERLIRNFDSNERKIISRQFERWHSSLGYSSITAFYEYDTSGFLIKMINKNPVGQVIQQAILINNERGNPLKLKLFDANGYLIGSEIATYNYSANQASIEVKDKDGKTLSSDSITVDFTISHQFPKKGDVFNNYGDIMSSEKYIYKRKYDEFGNWTVMTIYKVLNGKKKKDRIFKRKITYAN